jgi:hypothetical protein
MYATGPELALCVPRAAWDIKNSGVLSWHLTYADVGVRGRATNTIKDIQSGDAAHIIERRATNTLKVRLHGYCSDTSRDCAAPGTVGPHPNACFGCLPVL